MHYVYILYSKSRDKLYKGSTGDLKRRIQEHNSGNVTFTKTGRPWLLIYYQDFINKKDAAQEEIFLKSGKGKERIKILLKEALQQLKNIN